MRSSRLSVAALLALSVPASAPCLHAEDALPKAQPAARYEAMAARSPFTAPTVALATPTPPPAPVGPHWWDQMVVTSLMEVGGVYFAGVADKANGKSYKLESGKPDEESQIVLTEVQWNERVDQRTVTVRRGAEVAPPLRFDPSSVASPPSQQQLLLPPQKSAGFINPSLPPGLNGAPPPPPPSTSVVRRLPPISSRPPEQSDPGTQPGLPNAPEVKKIRPLGSHRDSGD